MQIQQQAQTKKPYGSSRIAAIDAARGAAMLFVCLAHFDNAYQALSNSTAGSYLVILGMVASPTFVTVSGLVAGFLAVTRSNTFPDLRNKLFDRGLFLLVVGHTILALSGLAIGRGFTAALEIGYITDAIGFAVMVGPFLVEKLGGRYRLMIALGVFVACWLAVMFWTPRDGVGSVLKHYLIGIRNPSDWERGDFPLLPWFAVYLAGTVLGGRLGAFYRDRETRAGNIFLAKVGLSIFAVGAAGKLTIMILRRTAPLFLENHQNISSLLSFYQKFPPGPVYLMFFGGAGMLLVAAILEAGRRGLQPLLLNQLRQIGLASLFIYVVQFYVYVVVLRSLRLPYTPFWPAVFLISLVFLGWAARRWNANEGNRFLTVGVGALLAWRTRRNARARAGQIRVDEAPILDRALVQEQAPNRGVA